MSNPISRRAFLKCAGAVTVAAGAASMLSGCDLVDSVIGQIIDQVGQESDWAMKRFGTNSEYAVVSIMNTACYWWSKTDEKPVTLVSVKMEIKNYQNKELVFKTSDITDVKIDGCTATVVGSTDTNLSNYFADKDKQQYHDESFFATSDSVKFAADKNMDTSARSGYVYFKLGDNTPKVTWTNIQFTLNLNGTKATFTLKKTGDDITSSVK